jgi:hypothetical protein
MELDVAGSHEVTKSQKNYHGDVFAGSEKRIDGPKTNGIFPQPLSRFI